MFKKYIFTIGFIVIIGMLGGTFAHEVDASASFENTKQDTVEVHKETTQYQEYTWKNFIEYFFAKQAGNTQSNHESKQEDKVTPNEPKKESPANNQEVKETDQNIEETTDKSNNDLHPFEQKVIELTNNERTKHGLQPLQHDRDLSVVSKDKSKDMLNNQYFAHDSPTYGSPFDMMQAYGVDYRTAGENIAKGQRSAEEVVTAWMNSPGHRANILSNDFTHIGVGYIEEQNIWTQQFIGK